MKKIFSLLLALTMILSLCACGGGSAKNALHLWETASTDIVDFSIDDAEFTVYASGTHNGTYLKPTDEKTAYGAPTGKTIVVISFTVKNKDRAGTVSVGSPFGSSDDKIIKLDWKIKYNGKEYGISGLKDGGFDMSPSVIINRDTQESIEEIDTMNQLLFAGRSESYRVAGIVDFEPESLEDTFEIQASIPDSKGKYTKLTYITEYGENQMEDIYNSGMRLLENKEYFYAMKKFEIAGDFPNAKEKYAEAELMYYLLSPTYKNAPDYFKKNKDTYELLGSEDIKSIIIGEWKSSSCYNTPIVFCENGILENQYISDGTWKISGDYLEYKYHDEDTTNICEVRKVSDGIYLLYKDGKEPVMSLQTVK